MNKKERTQIIIDRMKNYEETEFSRLQGILCMTHGWDYEDEQKLNKLVDTYMIAKRMDEISRRGATNERRERSCKSNV